MFSFARKKCLSCCTLSCSNFEAPTTLALTDAPLKQQESSSKSTEVVPKVKAKSKAKAGAKPKKVHVPLTLEMEDEKDMKRKWRQVLVFCII